MVAGAGGGAILVMGGGEVGSPTAKGDIARTARRGESVLGGGGDIDDVRGANCGRVGVAIVGDVGV